MSKRFKVKVPENGSVSAILDVPLEPVALLVLAHGAGAGMEHHAMEALATVLNEYGLATMRYQFPYMEKGSKRPDSPNVAVETVVAAVKAGAEKMPGVPLFGGGKSFGGRMTTTAVSQGKLDELCGIVCFSFPLHPPKAPDTKRADHLKDVWMPTLWLQGTRDDLADLTLVRKTVKKYESWLQLHVIEDADHGYGVLKSSGRTNRDVLDEIARVTRDFCDRHAAS